MIKQPRGGYINRKEFETIIREDGIKLNENENVPPSLIGLAIDYMTRFLMGTSKEEAFRISLKGARSIKEELNANKFLSMIHGLDAESIIYATKLVAYDDCFRAGVLRHNPQEINPNQETIDNIVTMIKRSLSFWKEFGPIVKDGFNFKGGYTRIISSGDGDYLTEDTLWEFKVLKSEFRSIHSLQLLVYYLMGKHSVQNEFDGIKKLGIFNPRLNKVYIIDICNISQEVLETVSQNVIGYDLPEEEYKKLEEEYKKKELKELSEFLHKLKEKHSSNDLIKNKCQYSGGKDYRLEPFPHNIKEDYVLEYVKGDRVKHAKFGEGIVLKIVEGSKDYEVTVNFDTVGIKKMFAYFAKLKKIRT